MKSEFGYYYLPKGNGRIIFLTKNEMEEYKHGLRSNTGSFK